MTLPDLARACVEAQRLRGPDALLTLVLPGPVGRSARRRLWPRGPLGEVLCESRDAAGRPQTVVQVRSAVVMGALARAVEWTPRDSTGAVTEDS